ncbi:ubiquitin receptor RAD23b [Babesia caballi]|uniref:Ubiquitin receptor RAD23b n=1 Tax=Babesia caballi TaxID=5871 RepID=A0AAV4LSN6_BABCB|nr:ubiquitin receptor RAD23b [Babesia caballi]
MRPLFDYVLEERFFRIRDTICHHGCQECKDAQLQRLEARASHFNRSKRLHESDAAVTFHDVDESEYYPFGRKHHHSLHTTSTQQSSAGERRERVAIIDIVASPQGSHKPTTVVNRLLSQRADDDLTSFKSQLSEHQHPKRRRITSRTSNRDYTTTIADVDLSTLKSHKSCLLQPKVNDRADEPKSSEPVAAEASPVTSIGATEAEVPVAVPAPDLQQVEPPAPSDKETSPSQETPEAVEADVGTEKPHNQPEEDPTPNVAATTPTDIVIPTPTPTPAPQDPPEPPKAKSGSIFGASIFESLNFSMPAGNPLFAPKAVDASHFSLPKSAPTFVFGGQSSQIGQPAPQIAPPKPMLPPPAPVALPPPVPQFNIPGFSDAKLTQPDANTPNTFAINAFPKAKRGGIRYRGGRR